MNEHSITESEQLLAGACFQAQVAGIESAQEFFTVALAEWWIGNRARMDLPMVPELREGSETEIYLRRLVEPRPEPTPEERERLRSARMKMLGERE